MISLENGKILIQSARQAITEHLDGRKHNPTTSVGRELGEPHGVFVTLLEASKGGALRGCIGIPFPRASLLKETVQSAVDAATEDPRFEPVSRDELGQLVIEVTVLSPIENIMVKDPRDLPLNIQVGRDGLFVDGMGSRGLLLPQVAVDENFDEEEFLNECCLKAGLIPDAWLTGRVRVARFQGQVFSEEQPGGKVFERKLRGTGHKG